MKVVVKEPGKQAYVKDIDNKLEAYREIIGGTLEAVPLRNQMRLICHDEGKWLGLDPNVNYYGDIVVGNVIVAGVGIDDFVGLTNEQVEEALAFLTNAAV